MNDNAENRFIVLLIGPEGSGRAHIGTLIERHFGIPFVDCKAIGDAAYGQNASPCAKTLADDPLEHRLSDIEQALRNHGSATIKTTGDEEYFDRLRARLAQMASLCLVNIRTNATASKDIRLIWDLVLENDPFLDDARVVKALSFMLPVPPLGQEKDEPASPPTESFETDIGERVIEQIRTVYDPEIPVNIFDLGLVYNIDIKTNDNGQFDVAIDMTLTSPNCPMAEQIPPSVQSAVKEIQGSGDVTVNLVWDPPWDRSRMTDEARMQLDMF